MFIDSHAHLTSLSVYEHVDEILMRAKQKQVDAIVNICTDSDTLHKGIELRKKYPWIYNAAATTPHDVEKEGELFFPEVEKAAMAKELVAIGETGLDYYYEHSNKKVQNQYLSRYLSLARRTNLPVIFHCRDAFADLFAMTDAEYKGQKALLHCFTGTIEEAKGVLERGWFLSISGIVTFKKSESLRDVAAYVPLDRLLIETDTPYLAPQSHRGKMNEPSFMIETAEVIAEVKKISLEDLAMHTRNNARAFFSF